MFVAIDNKDMDVFKIEEWINETRDANGGVISPEFAMEILSKTNFYGHIKKVLKNIKEKNKTKEELLAYKEFILSCVDEREMSPQALEMLQEMADVCEVRDEFDEKNAKPKWYDKDDCYKVVVVRTKEEFKALEGNDLRIFFDADEVDLTWCDLDKVKKIRFRDGAVVDLNHAKKLSKDLDLSMCSKVDMFMCDLEGLKLKFRDGAEVNLRRAEHLPKDLDVSMCSVVDLSYCNLEGFNFKFREGAEVYLNNAYNFSKELDLSMCSYVDLSECDLEGVERIKFREEAEVDLMGAKNLPKELDLSMCSKVDLSRCDLTGVEKIKIKFKNKAQKEKFMKKAKNFSGKVEYDNIFTRIRDKFGTKEI